MKKLLLLLPVLILAGAAAWWFLLRAPAAEEIAAADDVPAVKFLDLHPLTVPVVREGMVEKVVRLDLALELQTADVADKVKAALPRLTDAYVVELYALLGHRRMEAERYDAAIIKRRLQAASDRVLGAGVVSGVLIQGMAVAQSQ